MSSRPPHRVMPALCRVTPPDTEAFECRSCVAAHWDAHGLLPHCPFKSCYGAANQVVMFQTGFLVGK